MLSAPAAVAQNAPYCLKSTSGVTNCLYQSMAQCNQAKKGADQCLTKAQAGTTGLGSGSSGSRISPSGGMSSPSKSR
jgi:uncharacterized protein YgiB involved in biofilm formation